MLNDLGAEFVDRGHEVVALAPGSFGQKAALEIEIYKRLPSGDSEQCKRV